MKSTKSWTRDETAAALLDAMRTARTAAKAPKVDATERARREQEWRAALERELATLRAELAQ